MQNPHDTDGFNDLTEDEQRIRLIEHTIGCHKEALGVMKKTGGIAEVSILVMTREITKLERSLAELQNR